MRCRCSCRCSNFFPVRLNFSAPILCERCTGHVQKNLTARIDTSILHGPRHKRHHTQGQFLRRNTMRKLTEISVVDTWPREETVGPQSYQIAPLLQRDRFREIVQEGEISYYVYDVTSVTLTPMTGDQAHFCTPSGESKLVVDARKNSNWHCTERSLWRVTSRQSFH